MYIRNYTLILEKRSVLIKDTSLISILIYPPTYQNILHLRPIPYLGFNRLWAPHSSDLPSTWSRHCFHNPASSNFTDLGTYNSHTPLDFSLLPCWRRNINHIWSYYLSTSNSRIIQHIHCWNHLQMASGYSVPTSDQRSKNSTWVSVAQSLLSNRQRRNHPCAK